MWCLKPNQQEGIVQKEDRSSNFKKGKEKKEKVFKQAICIISNKPEDGCPNSLVIEDTQIAKYNKILLDPISVESIRKCENARCQQGLGETRTPMLPGGTISGTTFWHMCTHSWFMSMYGKNHHNVKVN